MSRYRVGVFCVALIACVVWTAPSHAQATGYLRVNFAKAGLVVGAGAGRGVLTYRGRDYPFRVSGLSLGVTVGASAMRLTGRATNIRELNDFEGTYEAVGGGAALVGGLGGVQLTNAKGVMITLQGPKAGMEFAANLSSIRISLPGGVQKPSQRRIAL
jgi:hypothetical protein